MHHHNTTELNCRYIQLENSLVSLQILETVNSLFDINRPVMNPRHLGTWTTRNLDISVLTWTSRYSVLDISVLTWTVRDLNETIFGTDYNCLLLINCQYFCTSSSLIYDPKVDRYVFLIIPVQIDPGDRCFCVLIFIYIFIILTSIYYLQK